MKNTATNLSSAAGNGNRKRLPKAERIAISLYKRTLNRKRFGRFLRILGPGLVTGAADDDPSGIATYSQAGAMNGFGLLWAFPLMYPLLLGVQESCSRIGAVTGKGLAAVIKEYYGRRILLFAVLLVVSANAVNIGADLGAMAEATRLFVDLPQIFLAVLYAAIVVLLVVFVNYRTYARILKWLALSLLAYPLTAFMAGLDWAQVLRSTFLSVPRLDAETMYILVGIIGTTVSPYLFFWDTSEVVEEEIAKHNRASIGRDPKPTARFLRNLRIDNLVGMTAANLTAWFIVVACASTLHLAGVTEIGTAAEAARALEPMVDGFPHAGLVAKLVFSIGIVGTGLLAVPVLAGSSSYAISEAFGWKEGLSRKFRNARGFYAVIAVATFVGLALNLFGVDPIKALVFTAVFNGIAAVPLLFLIVRIGNDAAIMGDYRNGRWSNLSVRLAAATMTVAVIGLFVSMLVR
ncbi:MAG: divalent metal cation transporter [Candidatus Moranbacteria bacterium]|nr:divalent metal cation transporter [Candidatus Moranbacteria bacterium]